MVWRGKFNFLKPVIYLAALCASAISPVFAASSGDHPDNSAPQATGAAIRTTGLPVPRFEAFKSDHVNMRAGPGIRYPIIWVYGRKMLPVEVTAEFDTWRRVRDADGVEGWVHESMLSSHRTAQIVPPLQDVKNDHDSAAPTIARVEKGVIGEIHYCAEGWCELKFHSVKGWIPQSALWGVKPGEKVN